MIGLPRWPLKRNSRLLDIFRTSQKRTFCDTHVRWAMRTNRNAKDFKNHSGIQPKHCRNVSRNEMPAQLSTSATQFKTIKQPKRLLYIDITEDSAREELDNLDDSLKKRLDVLKLEHSVMLLKGEVVPDHVTDPMWVFLLRDCRTIYKRRKFYNFLTSDKRNRDDWPQTWKREEVEQHHQAGMKHIPPNSHMNKHHGNVVHLNNLFHAMLNGSTLCFDMDFDDIMEEEEISAVASQLMQCYFYNKSAAEPFHLHLCNLKKESPSYKYLARRHKDVDHIPWTLSEDSYMEHYPHGQLVYLSPHSRNAMSRYDPNKVYIIGGLFDFSVRKPQTVHKAMTEHIDHVRFPLEEYFR